MTKHTTRRSLHPHHLHSFRAILFGVLLVAVALVRLDGGRLPQVTTSDPTRVLAYATSMSRAALLAENNTSRSANGLGGLTLNSQLNNSAQAKAQHMADNNYWAHVAPDGTQPWYFFEAAGYSYQAAGENLAYGFDTSFAVNQGWMNSAGHRANILGDYDDVGFGFVNAPNFQGGEYTIVVAHYGKPLYSSPAPAPAPTPTPTPAPAPSTPTPAPVSTGSSQASESTSAAPTESALQPSPSPTTPAAAAAPKAVAVAEAKNVSVLDMFSMGTLPGVAVASLVLTLTAALGYGLTHRALMRHALVTSERFVIAHPMFDIIALTVALALILTTTAARLQ